MPRFTVSHHLPSLFFPPNTSLMCKLMIIVPRFTVFLYFPFPKLYGKSGYNCTKLQMATVQINLICHNIDEAVEPGEWRSTLRPAIWQRSIFELNTLFFSVVSERPDTKSTHEPASTGGFPITTGYNYRLKNLNLKSNDHDSSADSQLREGGFSLIFCGSWSRDSSWRRK